MTRRIRLSAGARLVLATHNSGKVAEFRALLRPWSLVAEAAATLGLQEPDETGESFADNARLKALAAARAADTLALADDSGLCVVVLGGMPGIHSARWAGPERDFVRAMERIRERIGDVPPPWRARFVCALALATPDGRSEVYVGAAPGTLVWPPRGEHGFGYDPMFCPEGQSVTYGEMMPAEKDRISHRARAFEELVRGALARRG